MKPAERALLSRSDARAYCGGVGEETFDREFAPHVRCKTYGNRRYYVRQDIDRVLGIEAGNPQMYGSVDDYSDRIRRGLDQGPRSTPPHQ